MSKPLVSIIVPALNEEKIIEGELWYLRKIAPKEAELILADGKSSDHTVQIARKYVDRIVLENPAKGKRRTIAGGRNAGAKASKGEILLFVDCDTRPDEKFFKRMFEEMKKPEVVGVGCNVMPENPTVMQNIIFSFFNVLIKASGWLGRPVIAGNCVAYKRTPFFQVNGFDEEMAASEDQDLCQRIAKKGSIVFMNDLTVYTSSRRLKALGWLGLFLGWGKNTLNFLLGIKTKRYAIIREV